MIPGLPVQLEDDGAVHDGETQEAHPPQEDTAKHTGLEEQDHHLQRDTDTHIIYILFFANRAWHPLLSH